MLFDEPTSALDPVIRRQSFMLSVAHRFIAFDEIAEGVRNSACAAPEEIAMNWIAKALVSVVSRRTSKLFQADRNS
jgi:ABC-type arginine transport system ATPase subunit